MDYQIEGDTMPNLGFPAASQGVNEELMNNIQSNNQNSENPGVSIVTVLLNENNYAIWSRGMRMALGAKEKLGFIEGRQNDPRPNDAGYDKWKRSDYMVCSWILNSIAAHLREQFMFTESAKMLWEELHQRYGTSNGPMIYQIGREISSLTQGNMTIVAYFSRLKRLWDEINVLEPLPICTCNAGCICTATTEACAREERHKLMQFLLGLNSSFDGVKDQILMMEPWPNINKAYSMVLTVERKFHLAGSFLDHDNSIMMVRNQPWDNKRPMEKGGRKEFKCDYCHMKGHTKDRCYKLHGFPAEKWNTKTYQKPRFQVARNAANCVNVDGTTEAVDYANYHTPELNNVMQTMMQVQRDIGKIMKETGNSGMAANMVQFEEFAGPTI